MKIQKYKKIKANLYEITFENNEIIKLYDDVILKYNLLLTKEINDSTLKEIEQENDKLKCYYLALKMLRTKIRTEKEIRKKLAEYNKSTIEYVINRLKSEGYLNDSKYINAYIHDQILLKVIGPNKILFELKKLGLSENVILTSLDEIDKNVWLEKIDKYINKKINSNHQLSGFLLKQKIINDLLNRGFYKDDISLIIDEYTFIDDNRIKEKEFEKLKRKLSKKYQGDNLEYQINIALRKKGFNIE